MRDKTAAAKLLLEAGWTFEEVEKVLAVETVVIRETYPWPITQPDPWLPWQPFRPHYIPPVTTAPQITWTTKDTTALIPAFTIIEN